MPGQDGAAALFEALQRPGANALRGQVRNLAVNQLKSATPGAAQPISPFSKKRPFLNLFFPNYSSLSFQSTLAAQADGRFWEDYSIACLCSAIYNLTTDVRKQMLNDKIRNKMDASFNWLKSNIKGFYQHMLENYATDNPINAALRQISDRNAARNRYQDFLLNGAWIMARSVQWSKGDWPDRDWEMYHHYMKLKLLGASDQDIDGLIGQLLSKGLPLSGAVSQNAWKSWSGWWLGGPIDWTDFSEASHPITEVVCYVYFGSMYPCIMKEGNSYDFTASSAPGDPYRHVPSGCCFARGTKVVMADGSLRNIETISPGEQVKTPAGQAPVLLVSMPLRAGRELYTINQRQFRFADTHPFVQFGAGAEHAGYASANPMRLIEDAPFFSLFGVAPLLGEKGASLRRYGPGGDQAETVRELTAASAETNDGELLYDLILNFEESGSSEYYAGDTGAQYLVASEMPPPYTVPDISLAFMKIYQTCHTEILDCMKDVETASFAKILYEALSSMWTGAFPLQTRIPAEYLQMDSQSDSEETEVFEILESCLGDFYLFQNASASEAAADAKDANIRAGVLFNALWSEIGVPLAGELGTAAIPTGGDSKNEGVELNPYQIELKKSFPNAAPQLQITLESGNNKETKTIKTHMPENHTHGMFLVTERGLRFFKIPIEDTVFSSPCSISFTLLPADAAPDKEWKAFLYLPASLDGGYSQTAHLYDENGEEVGIIQFHSRAAHGGAEPACGLPAAAQRAGKWIAEYILKNFRIAVNTILQRWSTPT